MPARLLAARFENDDNDAAPLEQFAAPENIGIRWNLEAFGVERIEVTVKTSSRYDAYDRLNNHLGQRLAVYSHWGYRAVSGYIVEVQPSGAGRVTYIAKGPRWRCEDDFVRDVFSDGNDTNEVLEDLLTDYVDIDNGDYSNIDATSTDADAMQVRWPEGETPLQIIQRIRKAADSAGDMWDFWFIDEPFKGLNLQQFVPYFKSRAGRSGPDWVVSLSDMKRPRLSRSIADMRSDVRVFYGAVDGTCTSSSGNGYTLIDSIANFTGFAFEANDRVFNITDGSYGKIETVDSGSQVTLVQAGNQGLQGGTDNLWQNGDKYRIIRSDSWYSQSASASDPIFNRELNVREAEMNATQANQYAEQLTTFMASPQQTQSFVVTAPTIKDGVGAKWPLWEPILQGGGIIQISDLYPAAAMFAGERDTLTTFLITAMDYDHRTGQLTVHSDTKDGRLDVRLRDAGILGNEMVSRG